jgi:hypothetical protein
MPGRHLSSPSAPEPRNRPNHPNHLLDRQANAKITKEGLFLEELERNPGKYLPEVMEDKLGNDVVKVGLVLGGEGAEASLGRDRGRWEIG